VQELVEFDLEALAFFKQQQVVALPKINALTLNIS